MRRFKLIDGEAPGAHPCAELWYNQANDVFGARVEDWAGPLDVPPQFAPFVEHGEREIPPRWVRAWVDERIAPPSRQNIGEVLREHHLERYDPCELLMDSEGRSSQDGFYLEEVGAPFLAGVPLGQTVMQARVATGMTQEELAQRSGIRQEALSRIERGAANPTAKTLERIARALGRQLVITLE